MKKLAQPHLETMLRLLELADSPQNLEAMQYVVFQFDFKDYEQFIIECPPGSIRFNNLLRVAVFCDNLGFLVEHDAVDREAVYELFPIPWAKVEPIIQGMRRELDWPDAFDYFERLGRDYLKWWEAKRKRIKPLPPLEEAKAAPRALTVARTRPPAPVRPPAPPRPATAAPAARPSAPPRPQPGGAQPMRVVARPEARPPAGKEAKEERKPAGAAGGKSTPRPGAKAKTRR